MREVEKLTHVLAAAGRAENVAPVLQRAVTIARGFGARVEFMVTNSAEARAVAPFCKSLDYPRVGLFSPDTGSRSLQEALLHRAQTTRPDLIVMDMASAELTLASECPGPMLLTRGQPWSNPIRFAAAVNVSDPDRTPLARGILHTAGFLALGLHGDLEILYTETESRDASLRMERAVRLAQLVREFHVGCERIQMFAGEPEIRLPPVVAGRRYDVLVLGGESGDERKTVSRVMRRLVESAPGDVLLVNPSKTRERHARGGASTGKQCSDQRQQFP